MIICYFSSEKSSMSGAKTICNGVEKKVLVVDCRSYSVAFANRVKGGGSECTGISQTSILVVIQNRSVPIRY